MTDSSLIGATIGNYEVRSLVGEGGMGSVYLAEHRTIGRRVAIKVLSPHLSHLPGLTERFLVEAKTVARLEHPNIVGIYDFGQTEEGALYCIMEWLAGRELRAVLLERGRLSAVEAWPYLEQLCQALQAAHALGVVHRDLKPENIFVLDRQPLALKVLDFGIAKVMEAEGQKVTMTQPGMVVGTPQYMAPEQAAGHTDRVGPRTDLYAVGVLLYQMLAGRPPFLSESQAILLAMHLRDEPPPLAGLAPETPEAVVKLVASCLAKLPEERPASAAELAARYAEAIGLASGEPASAPLRREEPRAAAATPVPVDAGSVTVGLAAAPSARVIAAGFDRAQVGLAESATLALPGTPLPAAPLPAAPLPGTPLPGTLLLGTPLLGTPLPVPVPTEDDPVALAALLETLDRLMHEKRHFPPVLEGLAATATADERGNLSARQLAQTVLKDGTSSRKLLGLLNAAYFGRHGGRIRSLSRAVVMLGYEPVRTAAVGAALFPALGTRAEELTDSAVHGLLVALAAQLLAPQVGLTVHEEAFLVGLFSNLGRHLILHYLPERHAEVRRRMGAQRLDETAAARLVLGASFEAVSVGMASRWRLPAPLVEGMRSLPPEALERADETLRLRAVVGFARELVSSLGAPPGEQTAQIFDALLARYRAALGVDAPAVLKLVSLSLRVLHERTAQVVDLDWGASRLVKRAGAWLAQRQAESERTAAPTPTPRPGATEGARHAASRATVLHEGLGQIAEAVRTSAPVEGTLGLILDTAYHGLTFGRVVLFLLTADRSALLARGGRGEGVEALLGQLAVPVDPRGGDLFSRAILEQRDVVVEDCRDPQQARAIPNWYRNTFDAQAFLAYPIVVTMRPMGLLYADCPALRRQELPFFDKLRNQAVAALRGLRRS